MINPMDLTGKHILITGASSGIGRATSILCSQLGARVCMIARSEERLNETFNCMEGEGHAYYSFDLNQLKDIEALMKQIITENGMLDGFVHCAGICENRPIKLTKPDFLSETMHSNFATFAELLRVLSNKRCANNGASFVGISSVAAFVGAKAQGAYAASKAAINGLVHPAAKELADRGIRVNSVAFGLIDTPMRANSFIAIGGDEEALIRERQYLGLGTVQDAANTIAFLLSDASRFITGTTLVADGGTLS